MTDITRLLKTTLAGQIAETLDARDGKVDGQISKSIWDEFVNGKSGKSINDSIDVVRVMKSISTYLRRNKNSSLSIDNLAKIWLKEEKKKLAESNKKVNDTSQAQSPEFVAKDKVLEDSTPAPVQEESSKNVNDQREQAMYLDDIVVYENGRINSKELFKAIDIIRQNVAEGKYEKNSELKDAFETVLVKENIKESETYRDGGSCRWKLRDGTEIFYNNKIGSPDNGYLTITYTDGTTEKINVASKNNTNKSPFPLLNNINFTKVSDKELQ